MQTGEQIGIMNNAAPSASLIARARAGDLDSFEEIMVLHQQRVFRTAYRILGNQEDAQDAAQEVFLRLYKYLKKFDDSRELAPWLYRMTVNACRDLLRKRPHTEELPDTLPAQESAAIDLTAERRWMAAALNTLPEKERAALVLRDIEGLSTAEVADILGSTETTVRSQICRARIKIKEFRDRILRRQS